MIAKGSNSCLIQVILDFVSHLLCAFKFLGDQLLSIVGPIELFLSIVGPTKAPHISLLPIHNNNRENIFFCNFFQNLVGSPFQAHPRSQFLVIIRPDACPSQSSHWLKFEHIWTSFEWFLGQFSGSTNFWTNFHLNSRITLILFRLDPNQEGMSLIYTPYLEAQSVIW